MIATEFIKQILLVLLYLIIIVAAVRLGIMFRKKKNLEENNKVEKQE